MLNFLEKNWKLLGIVFCLFVLSGAAVVLYNMKQMKREKMAQEQYFLIEKKFSDLKAKKNDPTTALKKEVIDFEPVRSDFIKLMLDNKGTVAEQMAALQVADLLSMQDKNIEALEILQKLDVKKSKGLVSSLVQQKIGQLLADQNKCQEAINVWQKIIDHKESAFLHNETKIKQALCFTELKEFQKAEDILTKIANQQVNSEIGNSSASKEAEKYLRLINFKKAHGT